MTEEELIEKLKTYKEDMVVTYKSGKSKRTAKYDKRFTARLPDGSYLFILKPTEEKTVTKLIVEPKDMIDCDLLLNSGKDGKDKHLNKPSLWGFNT